MIMKRLRETVEERALAQQIRRKMIQRDHGAEKTRYRRDKGWMRNEYELWDAIQGAAFDCDMV
jgi:hypothetical protein